VAAQYVTYVAFSCVKKGASRFSNGCFSEQRLQNRALCAICKELERAFGNCVFTCRLCVSYARFHLKYFPDIVLSCPFCLLFETVARARSCSYFVGLRGSCQAIGACNVLANQFGSRKWEAPSQATHSVKFIPAAVRFALLGASRRYDRTLGRVVMARGARWKPFAPGMTPILTLIPTHTNPWPLSIKYLWSVRRFSEPLVPEL